jgi:hypothetical protein
MIVQPSVTQPLTPAQFLAPPASAPVVPRVAPSAWASAEWRSPGSRRPEYRVRQDGLGSRAGRWIAGSFALAWIVCPLVEPLPSGDLPYPMWQVPVDVATFASIVAAVVVLWRGGRRGALLGAVAGVFMLLETAMCPIAGHTTVGWWTWAQTGLSLFVLGTSAALLARQSPSA